MVDALADTGVDREALQRRTLRSLRFAQVPGQAAVAGMVAVVSLLASDLLGSDRLAGLGIAMVTAHAAAGYLRSGELVQLDISGLPLYRSWCAVHARGKRLSPVAEAFLAFLREERPQIRQLAERFTA